MLLLLLKPAYKELWADIRPEKVVYHYCYLSSNHSLSCLRDHFCLLSQNRGSYVQAFTSLNFSQISFLTTLTE